MTNREICERLIKIYALAGDGNAELVVCDAIRELLLDLALDYDFIGPVCKNCGVRTYRVRGEDVFACPICFMHRGEAPVASEEENLEEEGKNDLTPETENERD